MLTTLRSTDNENFFLDITISTDGSVAQTIGPIQGEQLALRWERYTLLRHKTWENILSWDIGGNKVRQEMFNTALRKIVGETDEYTVVPFEAAHHTWMERHPLPVSELEKQWADEKLTRALDLIVSIGLDISMATPEQYLRRRNAYRTTIGQAAKMIADARETSLVGNPREIGS